MPPGVTLPAAAVGLRNSDPTDEAHLTSGEVSLLSVLCSALFLRHLGLSAFLSFAIRTRRAAAASAAGEALALPPLAIACRYRHLALAESLGLLG